MNLLGRLPVMLFANASLRSAQQPRSCGRFGPASVGSTELKSNSSVVVKIGSGVSSVRKSPLAPSCTLPPALRAPHRASGKSQIIQHFLVSGKIPSSRHIPEPYLQSLRGPEATNSKKSRAVKFHEFSQPLLTTALCYHQHQSVAVDPAGNLPCNLNPATSGVLHRKAVGPAWRRTLPQFRQRPSQKLP